MPTQKRIEKIKNVLKNRLSDVIILEDIYDPHNAAAVFRTMDAFGFQTAHLVFNKEKPFNPKKLGKKTSASANKWLDFIPHSSIQSCISSLKKQKFTIYATAIDKRAKSIHSIKFSNKKAALLFGNEHRGLSKQAIDLSDEIIYIPMHGFVQSLNLSVTAALCMYELNSQRSHTNLS